MGLSAADVTRADYILVGHAHFDHLGGADVIAKATGAKIIASNESCRVMRERGVPDSQLLASQGGERHGIADGHHGAGVPEPALVHLDPDGR